MEEYFDMNSAVVDKIANSEETVWINPHIKPHKMGSEIGGIRFVQMKAAQNRLLRFMPYIQSAFPETEAKKGVIESELIHIPNMAEWCRQNGSSLKGNLFLKDDAHLPIAGSVKARGGIYEVLCRAEMLAQNAGMLNPGDDYSIIDSERFRELYSKYTIQVGSTGNLGLSIGIMSAKLGFKVIVHMSSDAQEWKKELLRSKGVCVKEYEGNYSDAVAQGRLLSDADPNSYFVDDENSKDLFLGYSTVAYRLKVQLFLNKINVDEKHPLFVYLPCGVGGAPGGITYGLKQMLGNNVHCFFAEPTQAPCFTLGMATEKYNSISVYDIGLSGRTIADGLAVGRASGLVCRVMDEIVSGSFTVEDEALVRYQKALEKCEGIFVEPSACAGFHGIMKLQESDEFIKYITENGLEKYMANASHIIWATGGGLMPNSKSLSSKIGAVDF